MHAMSGPSSLWRRSLHLETKNDLLALERTSERQLERRFVRRGAHFGASLGACSTPRAMLRTCERKAARGPRGRRAVSSSSCRWLLAREGPAAISFEGVLAARSRMVLAARSRGVLAAISFEGVLAARSKGWARGARLARRGATASPPESAREARWLRQRRVPSAPHRSTPRPPPRRPRRRQ